MDAYNADPRTVRFTSAAQWYVVTMPDNTESWAKQILRDGGDGYVLLESVHYVWTITWTLTIPTVFNSPTPIIPGVSPGPSGG